jgi:hypothetical protein
MIDSGAFSAYSKGVEIDLDEYIVFCLKWQTIHPHAIFIGLDILGDSQLEADRDKRARGSYENWMRMRRAGVNALPIYHANTDTKWLYKYLKKTDHIGVSSGTFSIKRSQSKRLRAWTALWRDHLTDSAGMPICKVHGMGVTSWKLVARFPWHSVDSSSWLMGSRTGTVQIPKALGCKWHKGKLVSCDWDFSDPQIVTVLRQRTRVRGGSRFQGASPAAFNAQAVSKRDYFHMSPSEQEVIRHYLRTIGLRIGFSVPLSDRPGAQGLLRGVSTYYGDRDLCNLATYSSFMERLPWPRPFLEEGPTNLGIVQQQ